MASYFDEHDCKELGPGEAPNHLMHIARLLVDTGAWNEVEFASMFQDRPPPPASKRFLDELKDVVLREDLNEKCPVCLKELEMDDVMNELPCRHKFHKECIVPWLNKTCSCPVCRSDVPTDDRDYEEMKRQKKRQKQRKEDIDNLHSSMFG